jgi:hypothetical protein
MYAVKANIMLGIQTEIIAGKPTFMEATVNIFIEKMGYVGIFILLYVKLISLFNLKFFLVDDFKNFSLKCFLFDLLF